MDQSMTLLSAEVSFLDTRLSLIHIPLDLYTAFLQPILQLLVPSRSTDADDSGPEDSFANDARTRKPWAYEHPFVNVSVTPVECSIVCSTGLAKQLFVPIRDSLDPAVRQRVALSSEEYVVLQVDGEGLDAGQRVLELSSPLAMNGISIFFITTYFSDYILVPLKSKLAVVSALETRGFAFSSQSEAFVNVASPLMQPHLGASHQHHRNSSSMSSMDHYFHAATSPTLGNSTEKRSSSPPPSSIAELQTLTFSLLKARNIIPTVDPSIQLVQCAGRKDTLRGGTGAHSSSALYTLRLQLGIVRCLISPPRPTFLSFTLTDAEPASLLLSRDMLTNFDDGNSANGQNDDVLLGDKEDILIPITLDLRELPMESTGIVCGIAGRLVGGTSTGCGSGESMSESDDMTSSGAVEMNYLSTARAGTVMVAETELERALEALKGSDTNGVSVARESLNALGLGKDW